MIDKKFRRSSRTYAALFLFAAFFLLNSVPGRGDWLPGLRVTPNDNVSKTSPSNQCDIAVDNEGNIHFVYLDSRNNPIVPTFEIYYREYYAAGTWSVEVQLTREVLSWDPENPGEGTHEFHDKETPGIAVDSEGTVYVSYANKHTQSPYVKMYTPGSSHTARQLGESCGTGINPVIAIDSGNNVHAVWKGLADGTPQVFYCIKNYGSDWGRSEQLTTADSQKKTPMIIVDTADNLHVVWADDRHDAAGCPEPDHPGDPGPFEIYYKKKPASGRWSSVTRLSNAPCSQSLKPYITAAPAGDLHVVWEDDRDGNFELYYLSYSGSWRRPEQRLTTAPHPSQNPHLTVDATGQLHLLWQDDRYAGSLVPSRTALFYKKKDSPGWSDDLRLSRPGFSGSITAAGENLHVAYSANYSSVAGGRTQVHYLEHDPTVITPTAPNEIMFVLDISGSMESPADGFTPFTRLYRAQQAIANFLDRYNLRNPADAYFGLVTFPHRTRACPSAETVIPVTPLNETTRWEAIRDTIPALTADGQTPLLEGIGRARDLLRSSTRNKMILLVSDGFHNCPDTTFPEGFPDSTYPVTYTVGIGETVEVDHPRLRMIAEETGGDFTDATFGIDIDWVKTIIQSILGVEAECDPPGKIAPGQKIRHAVYVTDHDTNIAFDVSWFTPKENLLDLILYPPAGKAITARSSRTQPGITYISRETYRIVYLSEKYLKDIKRAGKWTVEVVGSRDILMRTNEPYQYSVLMESALKMIPGFNRRVYSTGDDIVLSVKIMAGKRPLKAKYKLLVHAPRHSPGNWFAQPLVKKDAVVKKRLAAVKGDPLSKLVLRDQMLTKKYKKPFRLEMQTFSLPLHDDGRDGDKTAGDGIYSAVFRGTKIPGSYIFDISAVGRTFAGQTFRRQRILQKFVTAKVKPDLTHVTFKQSAALTTAGTTYTLTLKPKDGKGNYLGPGYGRHISFFTRGIKTAGKVRDNLDGSYTQKFLLPPPAKREKTVIKVYIAGVEINLKLRRRPDGQLLLYNPNKYLKKEE